MRNTKPKVVILKWPFGTSNMFGLVITERLGNCVASTTSTADNNL